MAGRPSLHRSLTDYGESTSLGLPDEFQFMKRSFHRSKRTSISSLYADRTDETSTGTVRTRFKGFYDDFTTIDWVKDFILESSRRSALKQIPGIRGQLIRLWDGGQGWLLVSIVAILFAFLAYTIDICEKYLGDVKRGYCSTGWFKSRSVCGNEFWVAWNLDYAFWIYTAASAILALLSCLLTLQTKTENPLIKRHFVQSEDEINHDLRPVKTGFDEHHVSGGQIYTAHGSGVPEVKTILSGFVIRRFLGLRTLAYKSAGLVLSISSGLNVGKEGPFVHLATCVGNITCRLFSKFNDNDIKRRQVLSAAASAGVALAFGSPLGGVLFSLEEVSYFFLPHQLFRIFFCAMMSALCLKVLDPYGTGKIVMFEIAYSKSASTWNFKEISNFIIIGVVGGIFGACFCRFVMFWSCVRAKKWVSPVTEIIVLSIITSAVSYSNTYTSMRTADLLLRITSPCTDQNKLDPLCSASSISSTPRTWGPLPALLQALAIKVILTALTYGAKVPSGIYVPTMVIGAIFGRIYGILVLGSANAYEVYAMAGAGAFMAGVTRMNITLAVILFELTGSMAHVLPFSVAILVANWTANAMEPYSLYQLLIHKNHFPFLDNKTKAFDAHSELGEYTTHINMKKAAILLGTDNENNLIRVSKLKDIASKHAFDACVPIIRREICIGTIPVPELEYALDQTTGPHVWCRVWESDLYDEIDAVDLTPLVDKDPITLDTHSSLSLAQMVFVKMGPRQICISRDGAFLGILHRKKFIDYVTPQE